MSSEYNPGLTKTEEKCANVWVCEPKAVTVETRNQQIVKENSICGGKDRPHGIAPRRSFSRTGRETPQSLGCPGCATERLGHMSADICISLKVTQIGYTHNSRTQPKMDVFLTQPCLNSLPRGPKPGHEVLLWSLHLLGTDPFAKPTNSYLHFKDKTLNIYHNHLAT